MPAYAEPARNFADRSLREIVFEFVYLLQNLDEFLVLRVGGRFAVQELLVAHLGLLAKLRGLVHELAHFLVVGLTFRGHLDHDLVVLLRFGPRISGIAQSSAGLDLSSHVIEFLALLFGLFGRKIAFVPFRAVDRGFGRQFSGSLLELIAFLGEHGSLLVVSVAGFAVSVRLLAELSGHLFQTAEVFLDYVRYQPITAGCMAN